MEVLESKTEFSGADRSIFSSEQWAGIFKDSIHTLYIGQPHRAKAVLNLFVYKKLGKNVVINSPFGPHCGLTIHLETERVHTRNSDVKRVMRSLADYITTKYPNAYVDLAFPPEIKDVMPFLDKGFTTALAYTYQLDLSISEKQMLTNLSTQRRKNIRDAEKNGLRFELSNNKLEVLEMALDTIRQSGVNYDLEPLMKAVKLDCSYTAAVYSGDTLVSAAIMIHDPKTVYYIAGGNIKDTSFEGAGTMVVWECILEAKRRGVSTFDFCGSSMPSIEKFFRGFGGELVPYFRVRANNTLFDFLKKSKNKLT